MSFHNLDHSERFIGEQAKKLANHGINLTIGSDFSEYADILSEARPGYTVGAPFDYRKHNLDVNNAFWIVGKTETGRVVHTHCQRLLHIGRGSLADYLVTGYVNLPPPGVEIDWEKCGYRPGPGASRMYGRIAYGGEFWIDGTSEELRGSGLSSILTRRGYWEALQRWNPDHLFAIMSNNVAMKGFSARAGWMHIEPEALRWVIKGNDKPMDCLLCYLHRYDLEYLFKMPAAEALPIAA